MTQIGLVLCVLTFVLALIFGRIEKLKPFSFSFYVLAADWLALQFPIAILIWGDFETKNLIVPPLQVMMFGMGTTMWLKDFQGVIKMPKGIFVGLLI